ncbi:MAG: hypothetical protein ACRYHQ_16900 [Janthinobacterium lividum]
MAAQAVQANAIQIGKLEVQATTAAGSGHPTTVLSLAHPTAVQMFCMMQRYPTYPDALGSDRLVLSEEHAMPIVHGACGDLVVSIIPGNRARSMTIDDLMGLRSSNRHPNPILIVEDNYVGGFGGELAEAATAMDGRITGLQPCGPQHAEERAHAGQRAGLRASRGQRHHDGGR